MKRILFLLLTLNAFPLFAQTSIDGKWEGQIIIMNQGLDISTEFKTTEGITKGTIDIPAQNAKGLELKNFEYDYPKLNFQLIVPNGTAYFKGVISDTGLNGSFSQSGFEGAFTLKRAVEIQKPKEEKITEKFFSEEEVSFKNGEIFLAGTLTKPKSANTKLPAVIMITGSGPQNRDEELFGFKPFKIIAEHLSSNGIAVLRYDDRGVGESKGKTVNESTTEEFAGDVIEAVKFLKSRPDINPKNIGVFGHSEGGIVGPLAASKSDDIAFVICMAGTGVTGKEIIVEQTKLIIQSEKHSEEDLKEYSEYIEKISSCSIADTGWEAMRAELIKGIFDDWDKIPEERRKEITDKNKFAEETADTQIKAFRSPWMKFFLSYNPAPALEKVKSPILLFFGGLDLQVPVLQNEKPMTDALKKGGNNDVTVKTYANANHLFQEANTGSPSEYANLKKEFVPGFLEFISQWIKDRFQK